MQAKTQNISFETVANDIYNVKTHILENGLKLYLSVNRTAPRIQTNIAVKTGSKMDPKETTGLAHYLEHMMFKGTDKIGALDWPKEKILLEQISDTYETYRRTTNTSKRKELYKKIDALSFEASKLVATNEYDKIVSLMGAKGTNAYTSVEQTVYLNDIPSNELEKWMALESERFHKVVLRLFHTELETVYEEFNISQSVDTRKVNKAIAETLFPTHPYGTQTTLGSSEHLQNPSMVNIVNFFNKYYVPNNMAIIASGDFDPEQFVEMAQKYFGHWENKPITPLKLEKQHPLTSKKSVDIYGNEAAFADMAWSFEGANSDQPIMLDLIRGLLFNGHAGLIDLNLLQDQKILEGDAWLWPFKDYTVFGLYAKPRQGQSFEDVEELLLAQLEKLKKGDFEDWLIEAIVKNKKLQELKNFNANQARNSYLTDAFVKDLPWSQAVSYFDDMLAITKEDVMAFCQKHFKDNYVFISKHTGEAKDIAKVEAPDITPIQINRNSMSAFAKHLIEMKPQTLEPQFLDYDQLIYCDTLEDKLAFNYVKNDSNGLFSLYYIFDIGSNADKLLGVSMQLFKYLGTDKYSPRSLKEAFFRLGVNYDVFNSNDHTYISLSGLNESFPEALQLFEDLLNNVKENKEALKNVIEDILQKRSNYKKDKQHILRFGMMNYAKYGKDNPYTNTLSNEELNQLDGKKLVEKIKTLCHYPHKIYYYGQTPQNEVKDIIEKSHQRPLQKKPMPIERIFPEKEMTKSEINIVHFPIVQAETLMVTPISQGYELKEHIMGELYNNYFGLGLSSIVFQEIRESKALAYSTYAYFSMPTYKDKKSYLHTFVGTQPDKLNLALSSLKEILDNMPESKDQFENARVSILKKLENDRVEPTNYYWTKDKLDKLGLDKDTTPEQYNQMKKVSLEDLRTFQEEKIKGKAFNYLILGDKDQLDMKALEKIGKVNILTIEEVLGY